MTTITEQTPATPIPARTFTRDLPAYLQIVRGRIKTAATYRQNIFFLVAICVVQIFVLRKVWTALYQGHRVVDGMTLHTLLVYLTLANLQNWVLADSTVSRYMYDRIREGQVAFDLVRPTGFVPQMFAHLVGSTCSTMLFALVALPFVALAGTLGMPHSADAFLLYVVSLVFGYGITLLLTLLLGMIAFWTMEISGLTMLYFLVNQFFAGALVPISIFPGPLRILAEILPFQTTTYSPVAIYVGRLRGEQAFQAIAVQLLWLALLCLAARVVWRRALHRVVVQGG